MFAGNLKLCTIFGFEIRVNLSWTFIALLIAWTLSQGYFPAVYEGLTVTIYWSMGIAGVIGLFLSIILHELAHSLVGRAYGINIKSITLWLLGGLAELEGDSPNPRAEFAMSIAGPIVSLILSGLFYLCAWAADTAAYPEAIAGVLHYLALLNVVLFVFNMLPAFPLDGGRVLRASLWAWTGNRRWATHKASQIGSILGMGLCAAGAYILVFGPGITGLWWVIMGLFIHFAASRSYYQFEVDRILKNENLRRFVTMEPVVAPADIMVLQFVDEWVYHHFHESFPILDDDEVVGVAGVKQIKVLPRTEWRKTTVRQIMDKRSDENTIEVTRNAGEALALMRKTGNSRLMVVEGKKLVGVISLKDMLKLIDLKADLENTE